MPQPKRNPRQRQGFRNNGWKCDLVATSSRCFFLTGEPCQVAVRSESQAWTALGVTWLDQWPRRVRSIRALGLTRTAHSLNGCVFGLVPAVSAVGIRRRCDEVLLHSMVVLQRGVRHQSSSQGCREGLSAAGRMGQ